MCLLAIDLQVDEVVMRSPVRPCKHERDCQSVLHPSITAPSQLIHGMMYIYNKPGVLRWCFDWDYFVYINVKCEFRLTR